MSAPGGPPLPYLEHTAFVTGRGAVALALMLNRPEAHALLEALPPELREEAIAAREAIEQAGRAWVRRRGVEGAFASVSASGSGSSATRPEAPVVQPTPMKVISTSEAAAILGVSERRARDLAAGGLGSRVGGRWALDLAAVEAERERRSAA